MVVEQDRANRACCDWSTVWRCRDEREAGTLALPGSGQRAKAMVISDETKVERKGTLRLQSKFGFEPLTMT